MSDPTTPLSAPTLPSGLEHINPERILAYGVGEDEFLTRFDGIAAEYMDGVVFLLSPITEEHDDLTLYLMNLFQIYLSMKPVGTMRREPFVMRAHADKRRFRSPDILIVLNENRDRMQRTAVYGPADICVEVVSPASCQEDYVSKLEEYEEAGVREYWLIDPLVKAALFFRLNDEGRYELQNPDAQSEYQTSLLSGLRIHVPTLWARPLPNIIAVLDLVRNES